MSRSFGIVVSIQNPKEFLTFDPSTGEMSLKKSIAAGSIMFSFLSRLFAGKSAKRRALITLRDAGALTPENVAELREREPELVAEVLGDEHTFQQQQIQESLVGAIGRESLAEIDRLLEANAGEIRIHGKRTTPLHIAVATESEVVIAHLIKRGENVNAGGEDDETPMHFAAKGHSGAIVELLHKAGSELETRNSAGMTPLHVASMTGSEEVVRALLTAGADADAIVYEDKATIFAAAAAAEEDPDRLNVVRRVWYRSSRSEDLESEQLETLQLICPELYIEYSHQILVETMMRLEGDVTAAIEKGTRENLEQSGIAPEHVGELVKDVIRRAGIGQEEANLIGDLRSRGVKKRAAADIAKAGIMASKMRHAVLMSEFCLALFDCKPLELVPLKFSAGQAEILDKRLASKNFKPQNTADLLRKAGLDKKLVVQLCAKHSDRPNEHPALPALQNLSSYDPEDVLNGSAFSAMLELAEMIGVSEREMLIRLVARYWLLPSAARTAWETRNQLVS